jgi:splicing factor U2AF 35 kDa subunit
MAVDTQILRDHYNDFFEDIFEELAKYGEIEDVVVCDNLGDHLVGNVYVKFADPESAARALKALTGRYYLGRPVNPEYSPVTDFREATCRQFEQRRCDIGAYCNFIHCLKPARDTRERTYGRQRRGRFDHFRPWQGERDRVTGTARGRSPDRDLIALDRVRDNSRERRRIVDDWNRELDRSGSLWGGKVIHRYGTDDAMNAAQENVVMKFLEEAAIPGPPM